MEITIKSTDKIVHINGVPARIWEGQSANGTPCTCFITRIAVPEKHRNTNIFKNELEEHCAPSPDIANFPSRIKI